MKQILKPKLSEKALLILFDNATIEQKNNHYFISIFIDNLKPEKCIVHDKMYFSTKHFFFKFSPIDLILKIKNRKFLVEKDVDNTKQDYIYISISEIIEDK